MCNFTLKNVLLYCHVFLKFLSIQLQVFRKEIQRREYYLSRIAEAGTERHAIPEENIQILIRRWDVTKRKITVLEERLWEVETSVKIGSRLSNLLLWLHEAESLIGSLGTGDEKAIEVPPKFLLRQQEVTYVINGDRNN